MARGGLALAAGKERDANNSAAEGQVPTEADDANHLTKIPNLLAALLGRLDRWRGVLSNLPCQPVDLGPCLVVAVLGLWHVLNANLWLVYSAIGHAVWGQTVGKRITGVKVMQVSGGRLGLKRACFVTVRRGRS